ncbi:DUF1315 family protein [Thalassolituus maritimus]|jgi:uncharacterized protein YeaC (DUF1315 family)|uniref:DUF1315 family protein n=1 Tax=Thalassolituus TaxID=187492 RepID=UPI0033425924
MTINAYASDFQTIAEHIPTELLSIFAGAVRAGYWPDGRTVTGEQRKICLEVLFLRDQRPSGHLPKQLN